MWNSLLTDAKGCWCLLRWGLGSNNTPPTPKSTPLPIHPSPTTSLWLTVVLFHGLGRRHEERLRGVGVWLLPYPGLLGFDVQLADLLGEHTDTGYGWWRSTEKRHGVSLSSFLLVAQGQGTHPVWDEMVQAEGIGIGVVSPTVGTVVYLGELEGCDMKERKGRTITALGNQKYSFFYIKAQLQVLGQYLNQNVILPPRYNFKLWGNVYVTILKTSLGSILELHTLSLFYTFCFTIAYRTHTYSGGYICNRLGQLFTARMSTTLWI